MRRYFTKKNLFLIPEFFFIAMMILYWIDQRNRIFAIIPIVIISVIVYLIFSKKKALGISLGCIFLFFALFFTLAFLSDFHKIEVIDLRAKKFIIYGSLFSASNFLMATLLLMKYVNISYKIKHPSIIEN